MVLKRSFVVLALAAQGMCGCGAPDAPPGTGGTDVESGPCGRGLVVVASDYQSTNVSLIGRDGAVLSSSFVSSASADAALSAPLSGDVVAPNERLSGDDVVLLDRFPASVLTWLDVETAAVRAQLDVRTGFAANPQDYLAIDDDKAYVPRFETNPSPGEQLYDSGGDVLIVDPRAAAIVGRIDLLAAMSDAPGFLPRANRMARLDDRAYVLLSAYDPTFSAAAPSRLVEIDVASDEIVRTLLLDGLHGCSALSARSPQLAIGCTGSFDQSGDPVLAESGVVLVENMTETARFMASDQPFGFGLAFADDRTVVATTLGSFDGASDALVVAHDGRAIYRAGAAFELGDVRCGCGACFLADAESARVRHFAVESGEISQVSAIEVDSAIGLPPRALGGF